MRPEIEEVKELVIKGSAKKVAKAVQAALDAGCDASEILNQGMVEAVSYTHLTLPTKLEV